MKLSTNIIKIKYKDGFILYNTLTKEIIYMKNTIISEDNSILGGLECYSYLKEHWFLSDSMDDDISMYKLFRDHIKYSDEIVSFIIHTNYTCNLKCEYCYQNQLESNKKMSIEIVYDVIKFINEILDYTEPKTIDLCFIGGEPLTEINTISKICNNMALHNDVNVIKSIITNGTLLNDKIVEILEQQKFGTVQITMDGDRANHNKLRISKDGRGTYDLILKNLIKYNKRIPITLNINLNSSNYEKIEFLLEDIKKNNICVDIVFSEIFDHCNSLYNKKIKYGSNIWLETHSKAMEYGCKFNPFYKNTDFLCDLYRKNSFIIGPEGDLFKCLSGVGLDEYKIGNINSYFTPSTEIKQSQFIEYNRLKTDCYSCQYKVVCGVNCHFKHKNRDFICYKQDIETNDIPLIIKQFEKDGL